jgi:ubiquitin related modifier 1
MRITIEFSGGAELLVGGIRTRPVDLPNESDKIWTIKDLLPWIRDNLLKERPELFILDGNVRPGILVLVNDSDWELLDGPNYQINENDTIVFISTLHGG